MPCTVADGASSCNRYKATIICQEVAKAKNVCQVCLLDLEYGIPVQARDTALGIEDESLPESDVGKEFRLKEMENAGLLESSFSKACVPSASSLPIMLYIITLCRRLVSLRVWRSGVCRLPDLGTSMYSLQHCTAALFAHNWMCNQASTLVFIL